MTPTEIRRALRDILRPPVDPDGLLADAREAATVRRHQTDPDVVALAVARARDAVDRLMWFGIVTGLLYTASSVQQWGATGAPEYGQAWWTAWLLTMPVEVPLVAILRGEQIAARHGATLGARVRAARLGLLVLMAVLNLWGPLTATATGGTWGQVIAHTAVPAAVVLASEAITDLRDALGAAIAAAARSASARAGRRPTRARPSGAPDPGPDVDVDVDLGADLGADETVSIGPAGPTKRETGIAYVLEVWPDGDTEPPMPADIRAGLAARGTEVSRGEASRIRTAAKDRRQEASA